MNSISPSPAAVRSILCADDNALLGEVMIQVFRRAGHRAEHVAEGIAAWDRVSRDLTAFDVVVTDHQMPGLNGIELVELLREAGYAGHIVVYSSSFTESLEEAYRRFGVSAFVPKTSRPEALLRAIDGARISA